MEIKLLPKSLRETLRSEVNIRSIAKCIAQLVFNSLDAKSASIAIRINLVTFKLQIIDNGTGISKRNLKLVGFRHATSKYYSIEELEKNPNIFPSRGESLASIIKLSQAVKITTRCSDSPKTFCKVFENGKSLSISSTKQRPSKGTTIIIENFMYNLPVRRKTINQNTCLEEIKNEIEFIALIHPNTSFSLRNDSTGEIMFHTYRTKYVFQTAAILYGKEFSRRLRKICYNDRNFSVSGLISLESHGQNKIQLVYVNSRFVPKTKIHTLINTLISKSKIIKNKDTKLDSPMLKQKHAAFIINIKCPYSELDILDYIEPEIEFKHWETVLTFIEDALILFLKKQDLIEVRESKKNYLQSGSPLKESLPNVRTSQVHGVIRGIPMKRKFPDSDSISTNKSNTNIVTVDVDVHPPPKKYCTEIVPSSIQTPEKNILETNSEYGKNIIMDMFLKSTTVFRTDDDLKEEDLYTFKSADKYTNRSSSSCFISTLKNNCNTTSVTTSTKISITKTVEHNSNNNFENNNFVFKVPHTPKLLKKKSTRSSSIDCVSNILARDRISKKEQTIPKNFHLDFIKNISERNNFPPDITNHFSKLFNNFTKKPKRNNYECTIKIRKRLNYTQFSDFLKPATKLLKVKNIPHTKQFRYENYGAIQKKSKEFVHGSSMLKTFFDLKNKNNYHIINNKYKDHNFVPKRYHNYLTYKKNNHNIEPLSSTFKNESSNECLPIYNIKRNNYHGNNYNKNKYYKPKHTNERINNGNHLYFPTPPLSFKPFSSNPNLNHLFSKGSFTFAKPDLYFNYNYPSPDKLHEIEWRNEICITPTFQSHEFTKDCCKDKQNIKPKTCLKKPQNYFDFTNKQFETECNTKSEVRNCLYNDSHEFTKDYCKDKQNIRPKTCSKKTENYFDFTNKQFETECNQTSNIILLPEVPETPLPENNTSKYYDSSNISSWMANSKKLIQSVVTANSKTNIPCIITNNDSHDFTKNSCKDKQNIKPKICAKKTQNYFDFTNKQFETECNKKSNFSLIPEVPEIPVDTNTFLNVLQNRNSPENNTSEYYDSSNISSWMENSKKLIQSSLNANNKTNSPCIITNNDSHEFIQDKQNIKPKTCINKTQNYFDFTNKQFETECNKKSNIISMPEVPELPVDTNTFLNVLQNRNSPENNTSKYYDSSNISSWMENAKIIQSSFTANNKTNSPCIITNNGSHEFTKDYCKDKQNYFDFTNKQFETDSTKKSNITLLPEVSETPVHTNTFLNCLQNRNCSENNTSNYGSSNISSWMENSKKLKQYSLTASSKTNSPCIITNNANKLNNIDNNTSIEKSVTANINFVTPNLFSDNSIEIVNVDKKKQVSEVSSKYSSPIISNWSNRKLNINKSTLKRQQNESNNTVFENSIVASSFSSTSNLIQQKDISKIFSALNQSILNDTLNLKKRNCDENDKNGLLYTHDLRLKSEKESNISGTNLVSPVFKEDSSNLILENTKNIDEILNISVCNDKSTNLNIIQQENNSEMCKKSYETTNNLPSNSLSKNTKESDENMNQIENGNQKSEWTKQTSELGNHYYLNLRTGMTSFGTPKNMDGCLVTKRHSFMPKGMSPIMFNTSTAVSKELSPKSKNVLHQTIANTENDELETVKWMNFLQNKDSEKFFNDLYSNNKNYETEIPNLNKYTLPKKIIGGFENYSFSKDDFNNVTVINQCDNKFIVAKIGIQGKYNLLVLFDQHAVHERIRLEKLLKDYEEEENKLKSIKCRNAVKLLLNDSEIRMLQNYKSNFENWGIFYEIQDKENVIVTRIPLCWQAKDDSNLKHKEYSIIESLLMTLIQEESNWLRNVRKINVALPLAIQNTIKTEACRSAIKFGDPLSKEQCENLIKDLLLCDLPFNCAHGRPTIVPIIDLNNINNEDEDEEINLNSLKI